MSPRRATSHTSKLELTVAGEIGPVLRSALKPQVAACHQQCTVLRLVTTASMDVPALVVALDSMGLNISSVRRVQG